MKTRKVQTGTPILPSDLWFHDELIARLWEDLQSHHVILTAPRRTGKTSVMDHLAAHPREDFLPVKIFVQDLDRPAEFILTLLDAFRDGHPGVSRTLYGNGAQLVSKVLGQIKEIDVAGFKVALRESDPDWRKNWKQHGDEFFHQVRAAGKRMLFIVDEFPDMVLAMKRNHEETVRPFLAWFRGHRQNPHPKADPIRWLLGGSVNLSSTLDALGCLDKINDFQEEPLAGNISEITAEIAKSLEAQIRKVDLGTGRKAFGFNVILEGSTLRLDAIHEIRTAAPSEEDAAAQFDPEEAGRTAVAQLQANEGGAWSGRELEQKFGLSPAALHKRRREHRIVSWRDAKSQFHYPKWQFNAAGALLPGVQDVLQIFRSTDEWRVMRYFLAPRQQLDDRRPLDLLRAGTAKEVVAHAAAHGEENSW